MVVGTTWTAAPTTAQRVGAAFSGVRNRRAGRVTAGARWDGATQQCGVAPAQPTL